MRVEVKLFAVAKQLAGADSIFVELAANGTVRDLRSAISQQYNQLSDVVTRTMIAINTEYVGDDVVVQPNSEIALIPPVSGG